MKTSLKKTSGWGLFSLKRHCLCLSIAFFSFNLSAQTEGGIRLKWKIAHGDTLIYKTVMGEEVTEGLEKDTSQNTGNLFFDKILQGMNQSSENNERLSKLSLQKNGDMGVTICLYKTEKGKAAARAMYEAIFKELATKEDGKKSDDINIDSLLQEFNRAETEDAVEFEGAIEAEGGIKSFYLQKDQKNNLALLFELPSKSVKIGDTWAIDVQFNIINMDFTCDSVFKKNEVKLIDIKKQEHDTIAVLEYDIQEFITGRFQASPENSIYETTYKAIAEFSLSKGRWLSYNGKMFQKIISMDYANSEPETKRYVLVPTGQ